MITYIFFLIGSIIPNQRPKAIHNLLFLLIDNLLIISSSINKRKFKGISDIFELVTLASLIKA